MKKFLLFASFVLGNLSILTVTLILLTISTTKGGTATELAKAQPSVLGAETGPVSNLELPAPPPLPTGTLVVSDARPKLVDNFFLRHNSPLQGFGKTVVAAADKNNIPFTLIPAIGFCEGNAGRSSPTGSYNTWGWGVYGGKKTTFSNWEEAINTVSAGLRTDYFNYGLNTPEKMMAKYTPPSDGSWAYCVSTFSTEILNP